MNLKQAVELSLVCLTKLCTTRSVPKRKKYFVKFVQLVTENVEKQANLKKIDNSFGLNEASGG